MNNHHIFGIRHHGPGSARALRQALAALQPDIILIEGPPDGNDMLHWLGHADMQPPISLLIYRPDQPETAVYFPYAEFSPEYQAVKYGLETDSPVRFFDLPHAFLMAANGKPHPPEADVFRLLGQAAGRGNYESWWNMAVEQRRDGAGLFEAVLELMTALREQALPKPEPSKEPSPEEAEAVRMNKIWADRREAHMRRSIRKAYSEGFERIAVVCGAWHAPALVDLGDGAADDALLHGMKRVKVAAAWVPWTYGRLSTITGYGAGIYSPGWYHHIWQMGQQGADGTELSILWLARVAELLRGANLDASAGNVIEAARLAEALAAMRGLPFPGLAELNEATQTALCFGSAEPIKLIQRKLIVGQRMGRVPPDLPLTPLQRDLQQLQRRLRLRPDPEQSTLKLDLRIDRHLERSHLLHRLKLLRIPWGKPVRARGHGGGTYSETWQLVWQPDFAIRVIEASIWGNTVSAAAAAFAEDAASKAKDLPALTALLDGVILAELPDVIHSIIGRIEDEVALSSDVPHMMGALPPLARVLRYGSVRQTDQAVIQHVVDGLLTRICIGLPSTCASLDDAAAKEMLGGVTAVHAVVNTLRDADHKSRWLETLATIADQQNIHGLIAGRACRYLLETAVFNNDDIATRMELALSVNPLAGEPTEQLAKSAAWLDGFLEGSELLLVHDPNLWQLLDKWITRLGKAHFKGVLPLLRRTFSSFSEASRRQMFERVQHGGRQADSAKRVDTFFDAEQANEVLPILEKLLGVGVGE